MVTIGPDGTITDLNAATASATHVVVVTQTVKSLKADFGPTTTVVGNTTFVTSISGGTAPYTCSWSFGDATPTQTGCSPVHTYIASGTFSATLTVTDSASNTLAVSHAVTVETNPSFVQGKLHWTHHFHIGTVQTFTAKISNPTTFTMTVTVTINIFQDTGVFVTQLTASETLAPGASDLSFTLSYTPAVTGKFHFTGTVTYSGTIPATPLPGTTTVVGTGNSKSGSYTVVT